MDGYGIIYKAISTITGKCYVGQTKNLEKRRAKHFSSAFNIKANDYDCHFHRAIRKYGRDAWEWSIILECPKEDLDIQETITIEAIDSFYNGYNETKGGAGNKGYKHSEETKIQMSAAQMGEKNHMFGKKGISSPIFGKRRPDLTERNKEQSMFWKMTFPDGKTVIVSGLRAFCNSNSLDASDMIKVAKGKQKCHKGFKCEYYLENDKPS